MTDLMKRPMRTAPPATTPRTHLRLPYRSYLILSRLLYGSLLLVPMTPLFRKRQGCFVFTARHLRRGVDLDRLSDPRPGVAPSMAELPRSAPVDSWAGMSRLASHLGESRWMRTQEAFVATNSYNFLQISGLFLQKCHIFLYTFANICN